MRAAAVRLAPPPRRAVVNDRACFLAELRRAIHAVQLARAAEDEVAELNAWADLDRTWAALMRRRGS